MALEHPRTKGFASHEVEHIHGYERTIYDKPELQLKLKTQWQDISIRVC